MPIRDLILRLKETRSGNALLDAADDLDKAAKGVDKLGDSSKATTKDLAGLRAEVERSAKAAKDLKLQIARTGDQGLFGDLRKEEANLKRFQKLLADMGPQSGGRGGLAGALPGIGGVPGPVIAGGVAVAALLTPVVGAAIGGAVLGAVGTGGIIGGIASASRDAGVRAAAKDFGAFVSAEFFGGGEAFVEPTKNSLAILKAGFADLNLDESFAKVAPSVERVAKGLADFGRSAMPGVNKALEAAGPILGVLADELPQIGDAFGDMLSDISESEGVIGGFHAALDGVEGVLRATGATLGFLGDRWEGLVDANARVSGMAEDVFGWIPFVGDKLRSANDHNEEWLASIRGYPVSFEGATKSVEELAGGTDEFAGYLADAQANSDALKLSLDDLFGEKMGVDKSLLAMKKGVLELSEALGENRGAWSLNTEAGLAHRQAVLDSIVDAQRWRDAMRENGVPAAEANRLYQQQIERIIQIGVQSGITRKKLEELAGPYQLSILVTTRGRIPTGVRFTDTYALEGEFRNLPGRASGGPVAAGQSYLIGERGVPEILTMGSQSGYVTPMGTGPAQQLVVTLDPSITGYSRDIAAALVQMLQFKVSTLAGGNVQKALGR